MRRSTILPAVALVALLGACNTGFVDSDAERGIVGAAGGAVISDATGGSATTGALIGGAAGVFCDDVGVCRRSY